MDKNGNFKVIDGVFAEVLIKLSWFLIMLDEQPFIDPVANSVVNYCNSIQNWHSRWIHPSNPHRCEHPRIHIRLPHVLACIQLLHIFMQHFFRSNSIFSFFQAPTISIHESWKLGHKPKWEFWEMRNESIKSHQEAKLGSYCSVPFRREISVLTL